MLTEANCMLMDCGDCDCGGLGLHFVLFVLNVIHFLISFIFLYLFKEIYFCMFLSFVPLFSLLCHF